MATIDAKQSADVAAPRAFGEGSVCSQQRTDRFKGASSRRSARIYRAGAAARIFRAAPEGLFNLAPHHLAIAARTRRRGEVAGR
jgi:hypothetical protein